jgi:ATP-dependent helicase/nuclease subunit B
VAEAAAGGPVLIVAPDRAAADEVARAACGAALLDVERRGFRELVRDLADFEMLRRGLTPVGRIVREALAARVAAQTPLTYLQPVAAFPGFPRALAETFEDLRLNGVRPAESDLAALLDAYERELDARGLADHAARIRLALASQLPARAVVTLDVAPETRLEQELLERVLRSARVSLELRLSDDGVEPASSLESLQRYLFSPETIPEREEDGSVQIFSTSGEALECVEIARRILPAGVPFDEVAILLRSPERHQPLVVEALRRAGLPAHYTHGTARPDAAGRAFLALLHCKAERLSASRFAEYLSLGQSDAPASWERLIVDAAVIGGPERWRTRLRGLREELVRRYEIDRDPNLERKFAALENLAETALPIVDRLDALPVSASWGEWLASLTELAEATIAEPGRIVELLEQLEPMADIGPVGLDEVLLALGPRLNTLRAAPEGVRYGKVWVGGIAEARGMTFRHVFVPGVNEGLFPRPPADDPLLPERARGDDAELLRIAAACASERLTLSYSTLDLLTGRPRVPSFYAFEAHRAAGGPDLDVRQFEDRARTRTEARIGWPAPRSAADAIDDAEFDLATLAPRAPGSGQYLKRLPGRAVPALRARWLRWHKAWKAADGLIVEEIGSDALKPYFLTQRPWSPSALQQFARCPYRFALHGIFGLRPAERPVAIQRMDPATRGRLYHEALFEILRQRIEITPENSADVLAKLDQALALVIERAKAELAPAIPQIWQSEVEGLRADLHGWVLERAATEPEWKPAYAEWSFGLPDPVGRDERSSREPVEIAGGFLLKGSIDLVERHRGGILRVVDHKTGRKPDPAPEMIGCGEALQPALYALAAEKLLGEAVSSGRLSYATIAQNYAVIDIPLNDWTRRRAQQALETIDAALRDGFLPAAPREHACRHCDYLPVCGPYEEERVAVKSAVELRTLKELRGMR